MSCRPSFKSDMFETWSSSPLQSLPIFCDHRECQCTLRHLTDECTTKLVRHFLAHPSRPLASGHVDPTPNINSQVFQENNKKGPSKGEGSTSPPPPPRGQAREDVGGFLVLAPAKTRCCYKSDPKTSQHTVNYMVLRKICRKRPPKTTPIGHPPKHRRIEGEA